MESISRYGAMAAGAALLTILASAYFAIGERHCPLPLLVAFYAAGAVEIVMLCRTAVAGWMRGVLILFIIASLTTVTARTDIFGVSAAGAAIAERPMAQTVIAGRIPKPAPTSSGANGRGASAVGGQTMDGGARVVFAAANSGDDGWAAVLNTAYDRRLGGAQAAALLISGQIAATRIGRDANVRVIWRISSDGVSIPCGSTTVFGSDYPALSDQFRRGFGEALSRSVALRRVSCP